MSFISSLFHPPFLHFLKKAKSSTGAGGSYSCDCQLYPSSSLSKLVHSLSTSLMSISHNFTDTAEPGQPPAPGKIASLKLPARITQDPHLNCSSGNESSLSFLHWCYLAHSLAFVAEMEPDQWAASCAPVFQHLSNKCQEGFTRWIHVFPALTVPQSA